MLPWAAVDARSSLQLHGKLKLGLLGGWPAQAVSVPGWLGPCASGQGNAGSISTVQSCDHLLVGVDEASATMHALLRFAPASAR